MWFNLDGEALGSGACTFKVHPAVLNVLTTPLTED